MSLSPQTYLWLAGAGLLLAALILLFLHVLLRRNRTWLTAQLQTIDAWLATHAPRAWHFVKRRFSLRARYGLTLTVAASIVLTMSYAFAEVTESWVDQEELYQIDRAVHGALDSSLNNTTVTALRLVTHFGDLLTALLFAAGLVVYFLYRRQRWRLLALTLTLGAGEALLWGLKFYFARDRPAAQLTSAAGDSFPSGHAFTAMALYGFLIYLVWQDLSRRALQITLTLILTLLILFVGLSRIFLSVHWVSDVLGGFIIGLGWLVFSLALTHTLQTHRVPSTNPTG